MNQEVRHHNNINADQSIINNDLFFILPIKFSSSNGEVLYPPIHRHPYYEAIFVSEGSVTLQIDFQEYLVERGSICLFSPFQIHQPIQSSPDYKAYLIRFYPHVFDNKDFFENITIFDHNVLKLQEYQYARAKMLLEEMKLELQEKHILKNFALGNLLKCFLITLQRALPNTPIEKSTLDIFSKLNSTIVEENFALGKPSEYAKKLHISTRTLTEVTKRHSGMSAGEYIRSKTIFEAQRLLCYTNNSIKEIAYTLKFDDVAYFSRFFKKYTKLSPLQYKEENCPCHE